MPNEPSPARSSLPSSTSTSLLSFFLLSSNLRATWVYRCRRSRKRLSKVGKGAIGRKCKGRKPRTNFRVPRPTSRCRCNVAVVTKKEETRDIRKQKKKKRKKTEEEKKAEREWLRWVNRQLLCAGGGQIWPQCGCFRKISAKECNHKSVHVILFHSIFLASIFSWFIVFGHLS